LVDGFATARVERIGGVDLDLRGEITLRNAEVYDGSRRLFFRSRRVVLALDGLRDPRLARVDLYDPEIFLRRESDGSWNLERVFRPRKKEERQPPSSGPVSNPPQEDGFPYQGIHLFGGTVHVTTVSESGREVTWTTTGVRGSLIKELGVLTVRPFDGRFYGGMLRSSAEIVSTDPFRCSFQVVVTGADVAKLAERLSLARPVLGRLDAVFALRTSPEKTNSRPIAAGQAEIRDGDLWDLPVFLSILSILGLDPGFNRKLDSAELKFTIEEDRFRIDQMNFLGSPLCLFGEGEMDLSGENLDVVFIPRLGKRGMGDIIPIFGIPLQWLLDVVKGVFVPVVLSGSFDKPRVAVKPGYIVAEPVRKLIETKSSR